MKKFLFACDLDNTLIHSYKHKTDGDICIEIYNGREQSFIAGRTVEFLKKIVGEFLFIPVTTRSIEQYNRINWIEGTTPKFAVVSNGANLLQNGKIDLNWQKDFYKKICPYKNELQRQLENLSPNKNFTISRIVDGSFLFLKCSDDTDIKKIAEEIQTDTNLAVEYSGQKIYLFPPKLNKGAALLKLKKIFEPAKTFVAGDSSIDIPMLNIADIAFVHRNLKLNRKNFFEFDSTDFWGKSEIDTGFETNANNNDACTTRQKN